MKSKPKVQQFGDFYRLWKSKREGTTFVETCKDGSIRTKPTVEVPNVDEAVVLAECLAWLRGSGVMADRLNNGAGILATTGTYATYGILGGGDIIAILPGGLHCEIECKAGSGGRLSVIQQQRRDRVLAAGGKYFVVHGVAELALLIEPYLEKFTC